MTEAEFKERYKPGCSFTLREVEAISGLSYERVRQIEAAALKKLAQRLGEDFMHAWLLHKGDESQALSRDDADAASYSRNGWNEAN